MNIVFKAIIGIIILLGLAMLGNFIMNKYSGGEKTSTDGKPNAKLPINTNSKSPKLPESFPVKEEENLKSFAGNFAASYYSYEWENFKKIESVYANMTPEMKNKSEAMVKQKKEEMDKQPQKYFTVMAESINSNLIEYKEKVRATLKIKLKIKEIDGAFVTNIEMPEIKPYTSALVDSNKKIYSGNIENLVKNTVLKNITIKLVDADGEWKINELIEE